MSTPTPARPTVNSVTRPADRPTTCPDCAAPLTGDPAFPVWCPACEWNLVVAPRPTAPLTPRAQRRHERETRRTERRERTVRARTEKVYALVAGDAPAHRDLSWLLAAVLAGLVHLVTLLVLAGSVTLLVVGPGPLRVVGVIGLVVAYALRPRLGRSTADEVPLRREEAPALYALADGAAAAVGVRPVDAIVVTGEFNAGFGRYGLRNRGVLQLGLPLWVALTPQQRTALLGHEFGHDRNGDHRRGRWLRSAGQALAQWRAMTLPERTASDEAGGLFALAGMVKLLVLHVLHAVAGGLYEVLDVLTTRSGQGAEYRADALAVEAAGSEATRSVLEVLLLGATIESAVTRWRVQARGTRRTTDGPADGPDLWATLAERIAAVPPSERERRLRLSERTLGAVDSTHPPTHLRIRMLTARPQITKALLVADPARHAEADAELAPHRARIAEQLRQG
ncbi:M48 family metallopeptidase [Kitasatospora sp. NPDC094015]|uniref:M48 family metallopeptidase n=1 Tax=Kitasatospora sp. NPDC094015 TaxID=3155205 RepID=UPI0033311B7B